MSAGRAAAVLLSALALSCGGGVQDATVLPRTAVITPEGKDAGPVERWAVLASSSRVDVVGVDVMGGRHPVTFDRWKATLLVGAESRVFVDVDMTSARGESELVTRLLKYELLEVDRYPRATLTAVVRPSGDPDTPQIVEGNATIHGIEKGLRFHGVLRREGPHYRFLARFRVSRDLFGIHAKASWDGLVRDDVHVYVDARAVRERVTAEELPARD